jgi:hypothetical protein
MSLVKALQLSFLIALVLLVMNNATSHSPYSSLSRDTFPETRAVALATNADFSPGPVFRLSNGYIFATQYDNSIALSDIQTANSVLNQYLPRLLDLFWTPTRDIAVTIHEEASQCGVALGCATGTDVWMDHKIWHDAATWIHEFTHTLQFSGPAIAVQGDVRLFYVEPTAFDTPEILIPDSVVAAHDYALWISDWGVSEAASYYNYAATAETHVDGQIWIGLYRADNNVFRNLNSRLNELATKGQTIEDVASLRELIRESIAPSTLDGLPIRQWLAVEGMLSRSEVGNSTLLHFGILSYWKLQEATSVRYIVDIVVDEVSTTGYTPLDASQSKAYVYDAVTRTKLADVTGAYIEGGGQNHVGFTVDLNPGVAAVRVYVLVVGNGIVTDRSVLIPLGYTLDCTSGCQQSSSNFVLVATPDNWLQSLSGTAVIGGKNYPIINGMVAFDLASPTSDVSLPVPPYMILNFVSTKELTSSSKVMILGLNYAALQTMRDSDQIITPEFVSSGLVFLVVLVLCMAYCKRLSKLSCNRRSNVIRKKRQNRL